MSKPRYRLKADGSVLRMGDSLQNLTAGLGTSRDKAALSVYVDTYMSDAELVAAYRSSWLARKIVDIPAFDACRKWRAWQAEAAQITLIEAEETGSTFGARCCKRRSRPGCSVVPRC